MKKSNEFNKGYNKGIKDLSYYLIDKTDSLNELGYLAWRESYILRAYVEMYYATGNTYYLYK